MTEFIHLRLYSSYSLAAGAIKINDIMKLCQSKQMPAVAITDIGNLFGSLEFALECVSSKIKPIIGCQLNLNINKIGEKPFIAEILLYAKDQEGLTNLLHLASNYYLIQHESLENYIEFDDLAQHSEGLIVLSGGIDGHIGKHLLLEQKEKAAEVTREFADLFLDRFYMEISRHGIYEEEKTEEKFLALAYQYDIPLVATNKVFFADETMYEAHDALICIADGTYVSAENRRKSHSEFYFKTPRQMEKLFKDLPEALENTLNIARRCTAKPEKRQPLLPQFTSGTKNTDETEELKKQARDGLEIRLSNNVFPYHAEAKHADIRKEYFARLEFELGVIIAMNFPGYFLIVSDFIKWSKRNDVPVGPGRGSGAGSLVAWVLEITDLDPIHFGLLFERFLNPERISMPDFDIDFCQEKREQVIKYVQDKYGHDKVAQIITFGKLQARAVVRDVGRVLQLPYSQVDRISKLVPFSPVNPVTLSQAIQMEPMLANARKEDPQINHLLSIALKLEGLNRHASTHAAGIVIADRRLEELVPLYKDPRSEMIVSQYSMKYAEAAGLVKFDFLGLKTLTVIAHTLKFLAAKNIKIEIDKIPLDDAKAFKMLTEGKSVGVFQFESAGMRDSLRKLRPDHINDLIALGALYRPGPMDNIPSYIARKHGEEALVFPHPKLETVLKETFGVIIYQEQVMEIAKILAGYSLGAADLLRRAMGKKIKSEMDDQREIFVKGSIKNGLSKSQASDIFDLVAKFAGYGFNKSHAAAYGIISYQTAYLKANYPVEFITALLNLDINDTDKMALFCQEAKKHEIKILAPCLNNSMANFNPEMLDNGELAIRYGLGALKNVGVAAMDQVIAEREKNGKFKSLSDFLSRIDNKVFNKRQLENLIKAGGFDIFKTDRASLAHSVENLIRFNNLTHSEKNSRQISLFASMENDFETQDLKIIHTKPWPENQILTAEYEAFGFYLNDHPLDSYREILEMLGIMTYNDKISALNSGSSRITLAGVVVSTKTRSSPRGRYLSLNLSDSSALFEATIFSDELLNEKRSLLDSTTPLIISGEARKDEGGVRVTVFELDTIENFLKLKEHNLTFYMIQDNTLESFMHDLKTFKKGASKVSLRLKFNGQEEIAMNLPDLYEIDIDKLKNMTKLSCVTKFQIA